MYFIKVVEGGKIKKSGDINEYIAGLKDGFYSIEIRKFGDRTLAQNRFYWGVVLKYICEYTGNKPEELHYFFKNMFIPLENGLPSTRELTKDEFQKYLEDVKNRCGEQGIILPDDI